MITGQVGQVGRAGDMGLVGEVGLVRQVEKLFVNHRECLDGYEIEFERSKWQVKLPATLKRVAGNLGTGARITADRFALALAEPGQGEGVHLTLERMGLLSTSPILFSHASLNSANANLLGGGYAWGDGVFRPYANASAPLSANVLTRYD